MIRYFLSWLAVLAALAGFGLWLARATAPEGFEVAVTSASAFTIFSPHLREIRAGGVSAEVRADEVEYREETDLVEAQRIDGLLYHDDGRRTEIRAVRGRYDVISEEAFLDGGLELTSDQGYSLTTTGAVYRHAAAEVFAPGPFRAWGEKVEIEGAGLRYALEAQQISVARDVDAHLAGFPL